MQLRDGLYCCRFVARTLRLRLGTLRLFVRQGLQSRAVLRHPRCALHPAMILDPSSSTRGREAIQQ